MIKTWVVFLRRLGIFVQKPLCLCVWDRNWHRGKAEDIIHWRYHILTSDLSLNFSTSLITPKSFSIFFFNLDFESTDLNVLSSGCQEFPPLRLGWGGACGKEDIGDIDYERGILNVVIQSVSFYTWRLYSVAFEDLSWS